MGNIANVLAEKYGEHLQTAYDGIMAGAVSFGEARDNAIESYYMTLEGKGDVAEAFFEDMLAGSVPKGVMIVLDGMEADDRNSDRLKDLPVVDVPDKADSELLPD